MTDTPAVSLCGLGNMGHAVAGRLAAAGPVLGFDLDPDRLAAAVDEHGITPVSDVRELAESGLVVLSLPTPQSSLHVVSTLAPALAEGSVIVETSTVNPQDVARQNELCTTYNVGLIDAAILSGVAQMAQGVSTLLVGGASVDIEKAASVLDALAPTVKRFGALGSGMAAKVINNAVAHAVMVVLVEAGALASATGVEAQALVDLLSGPDAGLTRPLTYRFAERIMNGDYAGGMPTDAARKDSTLALTLAQETGVPLFATQAAHSVYELAMSEGLGRLDYSSIATLWERWTDRPMSTRPTAEDE